MWLCVLLGLALTLSSGIGSTLAQRSASQCPAEELSRVQVLSSQCRKTSEERFLLKPSLNTACRFLNEVVTDCTLNYRLCYNDQELRAIRDVVLRVEVDRARMVRKLIVKKGSS